MAGTTNFQQFNPNGANMETDAQYSADALRAGGLANPSIFASALGNKLFYQTTTFIAAFAEALATKGYAITDASLANLAAQLANVMTLADMAGYAPLLNPNFSGVATAPTRPTQDDSNTIATTQFVKNQGYAGLINPIFAGVPQAPTVAPGDNSNTLATTAFVKAQNYQPALGFTPVQQSGGAGQYPNKVYLGWDPVGNGLRLQVDNLDLGLLTRMGQFSQSLGGNGWQLWPSGLLLQWGLAQVANATVVNFPISFPTSVLQLVGTDQGLLSSGTSGVQTVSVQPIPGSSSQFRGFGRDVNGNYVTTNLAWIAVGH